MPTKRRAIGKNRILKNMKSKKSLGQNFLKSKKIIAKMVSVSGAEKGDVILEIGPGLGILTEALLSAGANVIAVEKDDRLISILQEKFKKEISSGQLALIHDDVLEMEIPNSKISASAKVLRSPRRRGAGFVNDPSKARALDKSEPRIAQKVAGLSGEAPENFCRDEFLNLGLKPYKIVANIPYYITGQVIRKFLEAENQPESMTLLVQKEVAERIVAKDKKENLLSLSVKVYGKPKYIQTVKRDLFEPKPNVDSAIIHISDISGKNFDRANGPEFEQKFFQLIHAGFAHKRKQLLPNLSGLFPKKVLIDAFEKNNISPKVRAEDVSLQKWLELLKSLYI